MASGNRLGPVVVVAIATLMGCGPGPVTTSGPGSTGVAGATSGPVATVPASAAPASVSAGGPLEEGSANLDVSGTDVQGSWTLEQSSGDISPTDTLIAAIWVETVDNVAEGYGELITISMGGTIVEGTQSTAAAGLTMGFVISRYDAAGVDLFSHSFSSQAGECQVTMTRTSTGVSGTFNCPSIADADGHTVSATGTFAT